MIKCRKISTSWPSTSVAVYASDLTGKDNYGIISQLLCANAHKKHKLWVDIVVSVPIKILWVRIPASPGINACEYSGRCETILLLVDDKRVGLGSWTNTK